MAKSKIKNESNSDININSTKTKSTKSKSKKLDPIEKIEDLDARLTDNFPIVGIGASAGGLEALENFFKSSQHDSGMAFVVVQHLSPDYKSLMVELLSKHTKMKVKRVEDGTLIEINTVYLIPPKKNMTIFHRKLFLIEQDHHGLNLPIDIFFRSLAEDQGDRAIAIVLSGTGSDGTLGIRAIKGNAGMVMVQDSNSAKFDGMPKSAISTGLVDFILSPEEMPSQLLKYVKHPFIVKQDKIDKLILKDEDTLSKIFSLIRTKTGTDFTFYKPNTIVRRLERRISINQIDTIENYLTFLGQNHSELISLYKELLIGVTKFFRDTEAFDNINKIVIPHIMQNKKTNDPIRIWTVACSTGEEAYSLAILFHEYMLKSGKHFDVKIFATDIDKDAIDYASSGIYPESILADVSLERLVTYFRKINDSYQITETIRQMVIFASHNIIKDPPFSKIDLISCRNLLIYFQPVLQKKVLSTFLFSLNQKGILFLGSSESIGDLAPQLDTLDSKWKIYNYNGGTKPYLLTDFYPQNSSRNFIASSKRNESIIPKSISPDDLYANAITMMINQYLPPSVLIDENHDLVHVFKDVNKYIKFGIGKANLNIMRIIRPELSIALGTSIHKVFKDKREISYKEIQLRDEVSDTFVNLIARPIKDEKSNKNLVLLIFEEIKEKTKHIDLTDNYNVKDHVNQRIDDLEHELQHTKENLQATIEELETSNEELQATNEELVAANEELQSTNEELQSVNEELYTVNSEYQNKIDELQELNNDVNNWLANSNIGTIFLDLHLLIRKFTTSLNNIVNLIEKDIGRPISHISHNLIYNSFIEDIEDVLKTLKGKTIEVQIKNGDWCLIKILPYRTIDNAVKGISISFIDITERKQIEERLIRERDLFYRILEHNPIANLMIDEKGYVNFANMRALELLKISREDILHKYYNSYLWRYVDENGKILSNNKVPIKFIFENKLDMLSEVYGISIYQNSETIFFKLKCSLIYNNNKEISGAVFSLEKI
jgi:two-component system CheB/CheR fusion protein